jgi:Tfp pilus assembly protein PilF
MTAHTRKAAVASMLVALAVVLAGCGSGSGPGIMSVFQSKPQQDLSAGIKKYEDGKYAQAAKLLQASLDKGLAPADQVKAHKYLAFVHCVSGRPQQCGDEFSAALKIDPSFELSAAEAGHPTWGPVFRSVKGRR